MVRRGRGRSLLKYYKRVIIDCLVKRKRMKQREVGG